MAKVGRPTKCTPELIKQAWHYLDNYKEHKHPIPSAEGLAKVLNVAESSIYKWAEENREGFSEVLGECRTSQRLALLNGGLDGTLNSAITKLVLGKHGYHDRLETKQEHTHKNLDDMDEDQLQRRLSGAMEELNKARTLQ